MLKISLTRSSSALILGLPLSGLLFFACVAASLAAPPSDSKKPRPKLHPTLIQVEDVPGLPRVLLIGDSVSMWYTLPVRERLKGIANVHCPPVNCHTSRQVLAELEGYLGDKKWDVIHFNCGGHDISHRKDDAYAPPPEGKILIPLDEYQKNLRLIIERLKKTGAKLIWASTTPMGEVYLQKGYRRNKELFAYNAAAAAIMKEAGIPINDLYALAKPDAEKLLKDGVHFTTQGSDFLAQAIVAAVRKELPATSLKAWRKPAADRQRRMIFNNDGNEAIMHMTRPSAEDFLNCRTTGLLGSHVDSVFYCTSNAFGLFKHLTKVGQVYTLRSEYPNNQLQAMAEKGLDPLKIMADFGKQHGIEVFWSMRVNDVHDKDRTEHAAMRVKFNKVKSEHPEYLMGTSKNRPKHGGWTAVDFGREEIRELAFRYVEEVCCGYDLDGIELDFFRHPVFFRSTTLGQNATDAERAQMTDLLRRIRTMADEVGKRRGRPILIATRVPDSVEYSRAIGLDIERWMADDLLDLLIVAGYFQLNDWDYSVALARKYDVKIYPSLDESRIRDEVGKNMRSTEMAYRGRAANIWAAGGDGVYLFNSFDPSSPCWRELGDPKILAKLDKDYFASVRGVFGANGGNLPYQPFRKYETLNPADPKIIAPGKKVNSRIQVGEAFTEASPAKLKLRLRFDKAPEIPAVHATINGRPLSLQPAGTEWLEALLKPADLRKGANEVEVGLTEDAPQTKWMDLMLEVRH